MSRLRQATEEYLRIRRALGFKLETAGRLLPQLLDYLESVGAETIKTEHALRWATLPSDANPIWWGVRLTAVRGFARYVQTIDPATELPPRALLPVGTGRRRPTPYIYSDAEITVLMTTAGRWRPRLSAATMHTLIGLLTVTGMRISEAIRLDRDDLDLEHGRVVIRDSKFGKPRQLPLHETTIRALRAYLRRRDELRPDVDTHALLITATGKRLKRNNVERQFRQLRTQVALAARPGSRPPRIHDIRHTFAVHTMLDSYRDAGNPVARVAQLATYLGHADPGASYWYLSAAPELLALAATRLETDPLEARPFALWHQRCRRSSPLTAHRHCSPQTIASYRDTMRLLLQYAHTTVGRAPAELDLADLDAELISAFLDHLEHDRHNAVGTRNARLAAIRSLFSYASLRHPEHAEIARVLAIPPKRHDRTLVTHLTKPEITALLNATDTTTWIGRRDHTMIGLAIETGLRISELSALTPADTHLGSAAHVACHGKGRKDRITPLTKPTAHALREWLRERGGGPRDPVFPTSRELPLTRDAIARRLTLYTHLAAANCPTLHTKNVTPHVLRHTAAMRLLHAGVDTTVIALWLGHESVETKRIYLDADLTIKEQALARTSPTKSKPGRYKPADKLLGFLEAL